MSTQVTTAFVQQYSANVQMLVQQGGSKLRNLVRVENVVGKTAFFDQIGATAARRRPSRHSDTPRMDTPHARRRVAMEDWDWADLIDNEDKVRMLIDPTSSYSKSAANAMGRSMDEVLVDAMGGTSYTGETGSTSTVLPSAQKITQGGTGMTLAKLISAKKIMDAADVPAEGRHIALTATQLSDLLNVTEVKSADYNSVKALVAGDIDTYLGFKFHQVNGKRADGTLILPLDGSSDRLVYAWQMDMVCLGIGADIRARISERDDKNYATQVFYGMTLGATRMQEEGVVQIACDE